MSALRGSDVSKKWTASFRQLHSSHAEHRALAERVAEFAEREIELRAGDDEGDVDEALRGTFGCLSEQ